MEEWRIIKGFENYYVSSRGKIKSIKRNIVLKPQVHYHGYLYVYLNGTKEYIHRIVAKAFIPNPLNLSEINHINEDKSDNRIENLEWCTRSYNLSYGSYPEKARQRMLGNNYAKLGKGNGRRVDVYDKQGNYINTYNSLKETALALNLSVNTIYRVLSHKFNNKKFNFNYAED